MSGQGYDDEQADRARPKLSWLAVAAPVLGVAGLVTFLGLAAIAGVVAGVVARMRIRGSKGALKGDKLAAWGVVVSILCLIFGLVSGLPKVGALWSAMGRIPAGYENARVRRNLAEIVTGAETWLAKKGDGKLYPPSLEALLDGGVIADRSLFLRPRSGTTAEPGRFASDLDSLFDQVTQAGFSVRKADVDPMLPLVWERRYFAPDGINVAYADGQVEFLAGGDALRHVTTEIEGWIGAHKDAAMKEKCAARLERIAKAVNEWLARQGEGKTYPSSLPGLVNDKVVTDPEVLLCPASGTRPERGMFVSDYDSALHRARFDVTKEMAEPSVPLAWEKESFHLGGINVVYFDGHTEFVSGGDALRRVVEQVDEWVAKNRPKK